MKFTLIFYKIMEINKLIIFLIAIHFSVSLNAKPFEETLNGHQKFYTPLTIIILPFITLISSTSAAMLWQPGSSFIKHSISFSAGAYAGDEIGRVFCQYISTYWEETISKYYSVLSGDTGEIVGTGIGGPLTMIKFDEILTLLEYLKEIYDHPFWVYL